MRAWFVVTLPMLVAVRQPTNRASAQATPLFFLVPGSAVVAPGAVVTVLGPRPDLGPNSPLGFSSLRVTNGGELPATVTHDGEALTIVAVSGSAVRVSRSLNLSFGVTLVEHWRDRCDWANGQPERLVCRVEPNHWGSNLEFVAERMAAPPPGPTTGVGLVTGCNNVALTWADGTPASDVAGAVTPGAALAALWRRDAAAGRFQGWSPLAGAPNDLTAANRLDAVYICVDGPSGLLTRPAV